MFLFNPLNIVFFLLFNKLYFYVLIYTYEVLHLRHIWQVLVRGNIQSTLKYILIVLKS